MAVLLPGGKFDKGVNAGLRKLAGYLPEFQGVNTALLYREVQIKLETILAGGDIRDFPRI